MACSESTAGETGQTGKHNEPCGIADNRLEPHEIYLLQEPRVRIRAAAPLPVSGLSKDNIGPQTRNFEPVDTVPGGGVASSHLSGAQRRALPLCCRVRDLI